MESKPLLDKLLRPEMTKVFNNALLQPSQSNAPKTMMCMDIFHLLTKCQLRFQLTMSLVRIISVLQ